MKSSTKNYITKQGFELLRKEFLELRNRERPKVVEVVSWAAGNGDRSENGDYIYGKKRLREIDRRLGYISQRMEEAEVIDPSQISNTMIVFGAKVVFSNEDGQKKEVQIVGEDESLPEEGRISWKSPLARALLGKKIGDEVGVRKPVGDQWIEIISIEYS